MKKQIFLFTFLFSFLFLSAQEIKEEYQTLGFAKVGDAKAGQLSGAEAAFLKGNALRLNRRMNEAEPFLKQASDNNHSKSAHIYYLQTLLYNQKYSEYKSALKSLFSRSVFDTQETTILKKQAELITSILKDDGKKSLAYSSALAPFSSSDYDEFSPAYFGRSVLYVSNQPEGNCCNGKDRWTGKKYTNIFQYARGNTDSASTEDLLANRLNEGYNDGALVARQGSTIYFTRNQSKGDELVLDKNGNALTTIFYTTRNEKNVWSTPKPISLTNPNYSIAHPALSADGKRLYFSSNMADGFGGYDLYTAKWDEEQKKFVEPTNLGKDINTVGNEVFPYMDEVNNLYYSSDFLPGYGGLDVFNATNNNWAFVNPKNLGNAINSSSDDFGFIIKNEAGSGYFSSNRNGTDDVFQFQKQKSTTLELEAINSSTNAKVDSITYIITDETGEELSTLRPVSAENATIELTEGKYTVVAKQSGLEPVDATSRTIAINAESPASVKEVFNFKNPEKEKYFVNGKVTHDIYGSSVPNAKVVITNDAGLPPIETMTDANGKFLVEVPRNDVNYKATISKPKYLNGTADVKPSKTPGEGTVISFKPDQQYHTEFLTNGFVPKVGMIIELTNIYFELNSSLIRVSECPDLDSLASLLRIYPSMKGIIMAHTDSRGSDTYNINLSARRAKESLDYLVREHKVDVSRIQTKGYGETKLLNNCGNNSKCTEQEHARNRRVEFLITDFKDVVIKSNEKSGF